MASHIENIVETISPDLAATYVIFHTSLLSAISIGKFHRVGHPSEFYS
jgi:hypothetical protein